MVTVGYARVSSSGQSLAVQLDKLSEAGWHRGLPRKAIGADSSETSAEGVPVICAQRRRLGDNSA